MTRAFRRTIFISLIIFCISAAFFISSAAAVPSSEKPKVHSGLHDASAANYPNSIKLLSAIRDKVTDPIEKSHFRYLIARVHQNEGRCDLAEKGFRELESSADKADPWIPRARFALAECMGKTGEKKSAVALFSQEAEALLAPERRQKLAEELIVLARKSLDPPKRESRNEYRAQSLYALALTLEPGGELQEEAEHFSAFLSGDTNALTTRIRKSSSKDWGCKDRLGLAQKSSSANILYDVAYRCPSSEKVEAALSLGALETSQRAIKVLRDTAKASPTHEKYRELLKVLAMQLIAKDSPDEAWSAVTEVLGTKDLNPEWILSAARAFERRNDGEHARQLWQVLKEHTTTPYLLEQARNQWVQLRYQEYRQQWAKNAKEDALATLKTLGEEMPSEINNTRTIRGRILASMGRWEEAKTLWIAAKDNTAIGYLVESLEERGLLEEAQSHRAAIHGGDRDERLEVMVSKNFTTTEAPHLLIRSDGIGEIELRIHKIEVEDHLRSMATLQDLEGLDVDLITPDETRKISLKAPTYEGYRLPGPIRGEVKIGDFEPGVYALQSIAGGQQATSILRISNLAMTTRSVGGDLVVFLVDQTTKKPVSGAKILVSNGSQILEEGTTDAKGFYRASVKSSNLEILAISGKQVTWSNSSASQEEANKERENVNKKEQIWGMLDRDEAQPGEEVHYLAFVTQGESPRKPSNKTFTLKVNQSGSLLWSEDITAVNGVLDGSFSIPNDFPLRSLRFSITSKENTEDTEDFTEKVSWVANLKIGRIDLGQGRSRLIQEIPATPGGDANIQLQISGINGAPIVGEEISGDLADGKGHRVLGRTGPDGALNLKVAVDSGLPPATLQIHGKSHVIKLKDETKSLKLTLPRIAPETPNSFKISWEGASKAQAFVRIRQTRIGGKQDRPLLAPRWWPDAGEHSIQEIVHTESLSLVDGTLNGTIPALDPGSYQLEVELLLPNGVYRQVSRNIEVDEKDLLRVTLPSCEAAENAGQCDLEYRSELSLKVLGKSDLPLLLTIERQGILGDAVVISGDTISLKLPDHLIGDGRLVVTQMGQDFQTIAQSALPIKVSRKIKTEATFDPTTRTVEINLKDAAGLPISAPVFVAITPKGRKMFDSTRPLFSLMSYMINGYGGWSQRWSSTPSTIEIDSELLDLNKEIAFQAMEEEMPMDLAANAFANSDDFAGSLGNGGMGMGGAGRGGGGGGFGRGKIGNMKKSKRARHSYGISARHEPVLWLRAQTDSSGVFKVEIPEAIMEEGWYQMTTVILEGTDKPTTASLGSAGVLTRTSFLIETPLAPDERSAEPVMAATRDLRRVLLPGESITIAVKGSTHLIAEVASSSRADLVSRILAPDLALIRRSTWWKEQLFTFEMMAEKEKETPGWGGESLAIRRWIASDNFGKREGVLPVVYRSQGDLVRLLESLPEGKTRERAEALLGLGRANSSHGQAKAALLRLRRDAASNTPEVVGTLTLAIIALTGKDSEDAKALIPALKIAAESGELLNRARALEALAMLKESLPVSPASLMAEVAEMAEASENQTRPLILGALTRALLLSGLEVSGDIGAELSGTGIPAVGVTQARAPIGRSIHSLDTSGASITITAPETPLVLRLQLVDSSALADGSYSIQRTALRHGLWFRGQEIMPEVGKKGVEASTQAVAGRRMRVQIELSRVSTLREGELRIEEFIPPGTRFIPGSVTGFSLRERAGDRLILSGNSSSKNQIITYQVEILQPSTTSGIDTNWRPSVLRRRDGSVAAIASVGNFESVDQSVELAARSTGAPVWPPESKDLTEVEQMELGIAIEGSSDVEEALHRKALELMWPLLFESELDSYRVRRVGAAAFKAALALKDDPSIREIFSIIEARAPSTSVTQDELLQVARAFDRQGDLEYAQRAWSAFLNLRFLAEVGAGEGLINLGLPAKGLHLIHNLTRSYPDIPSVELSLFNLPQLLLNQAEQQPESPEGRFTARRYQFTAAQWLSEYLIRYSNNPVADQAALMQINVVRELEKWEQMIQLADNYTRRFPDSKIFDSFLFLSAYGHQRLGNYEEASRRYLRVAEEKFNNIFSPDRNRAKLAMAQIHHALGRLEAALPLYQEIEDEFPDAMATVRILENAEMRAPDIIDASPGEMMKLPLRLRGVDHVRVWVYAIDLERLFLREKQIRAVEDISLAGIEPVLDFEVDFGVTYGNLTEHNINLDLKKAGAYLVLLRGETVRASTLAIVTDLEMDTIEDTGSGALQVTVSKNNGSPQEGALIRYAHPGASRTESDKSDLRGMVRLDGYNRSAHILAKVGSSYAVYRGATVSQFEAPSQISTPSLHFNKSPRSNSKGSRRRDSLMEGQKSRSKKMQMDNIQQYNQDVLHNRRKESNFMLE